MAKVLLLLLLVGAFLVWNTEAEAITYDQGCPDDAAILPCLCTRVDVDLNLDCSNVNNDAELERVFQVDFPFKNFNNFTILRLPSAERVPIQSISKDTFGEVYFKHVIISHTTLSTMVDDPFEKSRNSLVSMAITDNKIVSFPFSYLSLYQNLKDLRLFSNKLERLADVHSDSLLYLQVSYNVGLEYDNEVFYNITNLRYLGINGIGVTNVAANTFRRLTSLEYLDLSENSIQTLRRGSLWFESKSLQVVVMDYNNMSTIEEETIGYCLPDPNLDLCYPDTSIVAPAFLLTNNQLTDISEVVWADSFQRSLGKMDYYAFDNNPVNCSCNIAWMVVTETYRQQITYGSACDHGTLISQLPAGIFADQCK